MIAAYPYLMAERTAPDGTVSSARIIATDPAMEFDTLADLMDWAGSLERHAEMAVVVDGRTVFYL